MHALRDALALARVLNRTLILPHFDCMCDRSEDTDIVPSCIYPGAPPSLSVPFKCSQHFVADTHKLQLMALDPTRFGMQPYKFNGNVAAPLPLRAHSFLLDPRAADVAADLVHIPVEPRDASRAAAGAPARQLRRGRVGHALPRGLSNVRALQLLAPHASARVLELADAEGLFGGWETQRTQAELFSTMMDYYLLRGAWCCTSRNLGNQDDGRAYLISPPPLRLPRRGT